MFEWWASLGIAAQVFYCIAIPSTIVIIIQTILLLIGAGGDSASTEMPDVTDIPDGGIHDGTAGDAADFGTMQLFTLQGIMTFLCVFGWTGVICLSLGLHVAIAVVVGIVLGFLAMLGVAKLIQLSAKLTQSGNIELVKLLGEKCRVYIPIPADASGQGKVTVSTGERFIELEAMTDDSELIPTGAEVRIIDIRGDVLIVEKED